MAAVLEIGTTLARYQAEIAKVPGMTDRAAAKAALAFVRRNQRAQDKAAQAAQRAAKKSGGAWKKYLGGALAGMVSVGALKALATQLGTVAREVIDLRNELADTAKRTGLAAETLQGLGLAAEATGQDVSQLYKVGERLPKLMADYDAGLATATRGFDNLGVAVKKQDGTFRSSDAVLRDLITSLGEISDPTTRAVRAMDLLGRKGGAALQSLSGGAGAFDELNRYANKWGVDTGPEATRVAADAQVQFALLGVSVRGVKDEFISSMMGSADTVTGFGSVVVFTGKLVSRVIGEFLGDFQLVADAFGRVTAADGPVETMEALGTAALGVVANFTPARGALTLLEIGDSIKPAWEETKKWKEETEGVTDNLAELRKEMKEANKAREKAAKEAAKEAEAAKAAAKAKIAREKAARAAAAAAAKAEKEAAEAVKARAEALEDLADITSEARSDMLSEGDKIRIQQEEELARIREIGMATGERAKAAEAMRAVEARAERDLAELREEQAARAREEHEADLARIRERTQAQLGASATLFGGMADLAAFAAERQTEAQSDAAKKWFAFYKATAIVKIGIDAISASMKAIADLGPIFGPIAAAGIGLASAVQIALVSSKSLPEAYSGYDVPYASPAGTPVYVHPGESVVDRSETASRRQAEPVVVQTWLRSRPIADGTAREIRRGGAARTEITRITGRLTGHSGGYRR